MFPCYAYKLANGRLKSRYLANLQYPIDIDLPSNISANKDPFYPRFWPNRLPIYFSGNQKGVFVCDMSDLFGIGIPETWTREVLGTIRRSPYKWRFYLLTKQPQNLIKFSPFPDNCWVGVTATDDSMFRIGSNQLRKIEARVRYMSIEPLLKWDEGAFGNILGWLGHIDWLIIGAQTRPTIYPKISWIEEIIKAADKAGIPVFLKNNLRPLFGNIDESKMNEIAGCVNRMVCNGKTWDVDILKQEMPE